MADLQVADISRWDPHAIGDVAVDCQKLAGACDDAKSQFTRMPVFENWDGWSSEAAKNALHRCVTKADQYIGAVRILGGAATIAQGAVEALRQSLDILRADASAHGLRIIDASSTVAVAVSTAGWDDDEIKELNAALESLQKRVNKLVEEANRVDDELAKAMSKLEDSKKDSIWKVDGKDVNSFVVGALTSAKVDLISEYGAKALENSGSKLLPWLDEIGKLKISRVGIVGNVAMMIPSIISDLGSGDSVTEAVVKEGGGVLAGIAAGAGAGFATGTLAPGVGNVGGIIIGAVAGGLVAAGATKVIGGLFD